MAAAAALRRKQRGEKCSTAQSHEAQLEDFEQELNRYRAYSETFHQYDEDQSGVLDRGELTRFLADVAAVSAAAPPTEEEVDFIIKDCEGRSQSGTICRAKFDTAVRHWRRYLKIRNKMQATLDWFDKAGSGKLEKSEVKEQLTKLNDGVKVCESDVDKVLAMAEVQDDGSCGKPELIAALANWHHHCARRKKGSGCPIT